MPKKIIVYYDEDPEAITKFKINLINEWNRHINYTRDAIISVLHNVGDTNLILPELMKNQENIGNIIAPYYGQSNAIALATLLKTHISLAAQLIQEVKNHQPTDETNAKWKQNAKDIAILLAHLDPYYWPADVTTKLFDMHLDHTLHDIYMQERKDWGADLADFDAIQKSAIDMADYIATAIIHKFPEHFVRYTEHTPPMRMLDYTKDK